MPETVDQEIRTLQSIFWSDRDPDGLAFASLADAFRRKGDVREALDLLTDGMSRHPDYATGHVVATRLYVDQGMHSEAELAARRVLELDPENLVALSTLVSVLSERGEVGEAARHKTTLFAADPDSDEARAVAHVDVGTAAADQPTGPGEDVDRGVEEIAAHEEPGAVAGDAALEGVDTSDFEDGLGPLELSDEWSADPTDAETPLELVAGATEDEPPEISELVPETMYHEEDAALLDGLTIEHDGGSESGAETEEDERTRDMFDELAADPLDLTNLSIGDEEDSSTVSDAPATVDDDSLELDSPDLGQEEVLQPGDLTPEGSEDEVMEVAALAPDEVTDVSVLAPDEPEGEVTDVTALAPDEPQDEVIDLAALAPDEPADEVIDLADLAPDEPGDDVVDLAALAPDEEAEEDVVELASLAPDASVEELAEEMELAELAQGEEEADDDDDATEPIYTRTLADLYIKQGFHDKALQVLKHIQERQPDAPDLAERIEALERGEAPESGFGSKGGSAEDGSAPGAGRQRPDEAREFAPPPPTTPSTPRDAAQAEDDMERRARELAEPDDHGFGDAADTPFAWDAGDEQPAEAEEEEGIGSYLEGLLEWESRSES